MGKLSDAFDKAKAIASEKQIEKTNQTKSTDTTPSQLQSQMQNQLQSQMQNQPQSQMQKNTFKDSESVKNTSEKEDSSSDISDNFFINYNRAEAIKTGGDAQDEAIKEQALKNGIAIDDSIVKGIDDVNTETEMDRVFENSGLMYDNFEDFRLNGTAEDWYTFVMSNPDYYSYENIDNMNSDMSDWDEFVEWLYDGAYDGTATSDELLAYINSGFDSNLRYGENGDDIEALFNDVYGDVWNSKIADDLLSAYVFNDLYNSNYEEGSEYTADDIAGMRNYADTLTKAKMMETAAGAFYDAWRDADGSFSDETWENDLGQIERGLQNIGVSNEEDLMELLEYLTDMDFYQSGFNDPVTVSGYTTYSPQYISGSKSDPSDTYTTDWGFTYGSDDQEYYWNDMIPYTNQDLVQILNSDDAEAYFTNRNATLVPYLLSGANWMSKYNNPDNRLYYHGGDSISTN